MRNTAWRQLRIRLASPEAAIAHACLGVLAGVLTAGVILAFRFAIEWPGQFLDDSNSDGFEALPIQWRFLLPVLGALAVGLIFQQLRAQWRHVGVAHLIDSLHGHGRLQWQNAMAQFIGSSIALGTGASGGREGPAVHLGAATASIAGRRLHFPDNSLRVLAACGAAAAIAASFNTPIAGVIFAMEVIMLEYTVAGFVPVILAAVTATAITQAVHGNTVFLVDAQASMQSLYDLPFIVMLGLLCALLSTSFVRLQAWCYRFNERSVVIRFTLAGLLTGSLAVFLPQIMGAGYDSFSATFAGEYSLYLLVALLLAKLLATAASCGLGLPIGVIGPSMLIGAFAGAAMGEFGGSLLPEFSSSPDFYALLGMAALMAALMNAPLAALLALVELTHNTAVIFPAMLVITVAQLCHRDVFKQASSPQTALRLMGRALRRDPLRQALLRTSVAATMDRDIAAIDQYTKASTLQELAEQHRGWIYVQRQEQYYLLSRREWLDHLLEGQRGEALLDTLLASQKPVMKLGVHATLAEAYDAMREQGLRKILVEGYFGGQGTLSEQERGVITLEAIEAQYNKPAHY